MTRQVENQVQLKILEGETIKHISLGEDVDDKKIALMTESGKEIHLWWTGDILHCVHIRY